MEIRFKNKVNSDKFDLNDSTDSFVGIIDYEGDLILKTQEEDPEIRICFSPKVYNDWFPWDSGFDVGTRVRVTAIEVEEF